MLKVDGMKNSDHSHYKRKPSCAIAKSTLFAISTDEWITLVYKSMKTALYIENKIKITEGSSSDHNSFEISYSLFEILVKI